MTGVRVIDNITKEYPTMFKVISFKNSRIYVRDGSTKRPRDIVDSDYKPQISSLARTKTLIHDLALCNDFELFCTFTFDPDKVNRFSSLCSYFNGNQRFSASDKEIFFKRRIRSFIVV